MTRPKLAKTHSALEAEEYIRLGWTLKREFYAEGDAEPYEYLFEWQASGEPNSFDRAALIRKIN